MSPNPAVAKCEPCSVWCETQTNFAWCWLGAFAAIVTSIVLFPIGLISWIGVPFLAKTSYYCPSCHKRYYSVYYPGRMPGDHAP